MCLRLDSFPQCSCQSIKQNKLHTIDHFRVPGILIFKMIVIRQICYGSLILTPKVPHESALKVRILGTKKLRIIPHSGLTEIIQS